MNEARFSNIFIEKDSTNYLDNEGEANHEKRGKQAGGSLRRSLY